MRLNLIIFLSSLVSIVAEGIPLSSLEPKACNHYSPGTTLLSQTDSDFRIPFVSDALDAGVALVQSVDHKLA